VTTFQKISNYFFSCSHGNFEEKGTLGQSKIIINFCINIIINAYYNDNCLNTSLYNYYIIFLIKFVLGYCSG
jgi:hypothetical protein